MSSSSGEKTHTHASWRPNASIPRARDRHRARMAQQRADRQVARLVRWAMRHDDPARQAQELTALLRAIDGAGGLRSQLAAARRGAIDARHDAGVPWVQVARELGITVSRLSQIRRGD